MIGLTALSDWWLRSAVKGTRFFLEISYINKLILEESSIIPFSLSDFSTLPSSFSFFFVKAVALIYSWGRSI
jgi:hypothetical protein